MENKKDSRALKWIYARTAGHRGKLILLMLCDAFVSAAAVLFAVLSKSFLDKALHGVSGAWETAAVMAAVLVAQVLIRIYSGMLSERIDGSLNMSLKNHVFGELMKKRYGDVSRYHSGELLNRMFSDTEVVSSGITEIVPNAVSVGTRLIAAFAALAILDLYLVAAALLVGLLVFAVSRLMRKQIKKRHREMQEAAGRVRAYMQESTDRLLIIKIFGGAEKAREKALSLQTEHFKARLRRAFLAVSTGGGFFFVFRAAYLCVLIYCAAAIGKGSGAMTVGTMTALLQLVSQVQQPFAALSGIMPKYYAALASAERLLELLDMENESAPLEKADAQKLYEKAGGIDISGVSLDYGRGKVLKNASAFIPKNKFTLISGATGSGKTTLFMLLLGIYDHEGGITLAGAPLDEKTRPLFAYVPQGNLL
ncbi:MAG: ABC transporter ATP-binding protein, partial [Clostridia bacterium]|nr:ABC transporter ATP-binding protein [Clostridia bacterium]